MKFAYMIMAHNEPYVLDKLIHMLDYPNNDIYIHVDAKSNLIDKRKFDDCGQARITLAEIGGSTRQVDGRTSGKIKHNSL